MRAALAVLLLVAAAVAPPAVRAQVAPPPKNFPTCSATQKCADAKHCCHKRLNICGSSPAFCAVTACRSGPCLPPPRGPAAPPKSPPASPVPSPAQATPSPSPNPVKPSTGMEPPFPSFPAELGNATTQYSWLWGKAGELWTPASRLADWSYAGYMAGEAPIPGPKQFPVRFNVKDPKYGARGDGVTDDTAAIMAAIRDASATARAMLAAECRTGCKAGFGNEGAQGVAVLLPAGRYVITQTIEITRSNVVVRGEGAGATVLVLPKALGEVYGTGPNWSYIGGFLNCRGRRVDSKSAQPLGALAATARKGERRLQASRPLQLLDVSSSAGMTPGRWVRLFARAPSALVPPGKRALLSLPSDLPVIGQQAAAGRPVARRLGEEEAAPAALPCNEEQQAAEQLQQELPYDFMIQDGDFELTAEELAAKLSWKQRQRGGRKGRGKGKHAGREQRCSGGKCGGGGSDEAAARPAGGDKASKPHKGSSADKKEEAPSSGSAGKGSTESATPEAKPAASPANATTNVTRAPAASAANATDGAGGPANGTAAGGFLPLTEGLLEAIQDAAELGLDRPEERFANTTGDGSTDEAPALAAAGSLDAYIYGQNAVDSGTRPFAGERIRFASRVAAAGPGWVELERPLPYDVGVYAFEATVQHVGFEGFTVKFPGTPYPAHLRARGYNAFYYNACVNTWIQDVRIVDADNGAETINSDFVTMRNISLSFTAPRGNPSTQECNGHHGLWAAASSNVLVTDCNFCSGGETPRCFIHDLTYDVFNQESVYANSRGVDMSLDMHRGGCHNNLWSNIDVGKGNRAFQSSGQAMRGAHSAANNTWWNIQSSTRYIWAGPLKLRECTFGPLLNFVGTSYAAPATGGPGIAAAVSPAPSRLFPGYCSARVGWWVEQLRPGAAMEPADLWKAMAATRGARLGATFKRSPKP